MPGPGRPSGPAAAPFPKDAPARPHDPVSAAWARGLNLGAPLILLAFAGLLLSDATRPLARDLLTNERGPVEVGTFLCFLVAGLTSLWLGREAMRRDENPLVARAYFLFGAFCLFAAMEEISWGESFFDFSPPRWWRRINLQGESNLHNLPGVMELNSAFVCLFGIAGVAWARFGAREPFRRFAVPAAVVPTFALVALMGAVETVNDFVFLGRMTSQFIGVLSEAVELIGSAASLGCVGINARMLLREWAANEIAAGSEPEAARAA